MIQRRTSRAPSPRGAWNISHTYTTGVSIINPPQNLYVRGPGDAGWFGWYRDEAVECATTDWLAGSTDGQRQAAFDAFQRAAFDTASIVLLGRYFPLTACRASLTGRIPSAVRCSGYPGSLTNTQERARWRTSG